MRKFQFISVKLARYKAEAERGRREKRIAPFDRKAIAAVYLKR